ncbi:M24 family metallopeptidase [Micromonospora endolithica]|uniref:Aminopeptidase P family protein n=1 Tax=Micromonospora endolithica TaxID=230091 RepID=A0A3A9Z258_9ACTN|nr:Xaa-Pro peptidase family protein [Micromonospora endolithica]RKN41506.1 aminopeptidase P family protein [Micromonospora endolithica]TWJ21948.1 Xaa-Pro aminopeptidase [Micromonospora endolithica]
MGDEALYPARRLAVAQRATAAAGLDALLLTPGSDLRYLTGYDAHEGERLTCLVLPAEGEPTLIVPTLERPAAEAAPDTGVRVVDHADGTDPYPLVVAALGGPVAAVGLADRMWAEQVLALRAALPGVAQRLASEVLRELRIRKSPAEVAALAEAGAAIDAVHRRMGQWLRPGRTEAEVAADIATAIRAAGHVRVDFVIVAAGPNGASPHHGTSDRPIGAGEPVVVDIGGTMASGYRSDCTRTYTVGGPAPAEFADYYAVLHEAQRAAVAAIRPGVSAEAVDAVARDVIADAGYGDAFLHRTGHGIGLDGHEEPYVVAGNRRPLEAGMAFSVEPGIYLAGRHGARIEDIVVCATRGVQRLNTTPTELIAL